MFVFFYNLFKQTCLVHQQQLNGSSKQLPIELMGNLILQKIQIYRNFSVKFNGSIGVSYIVI
jgi:hypothetical protein